MRLDLYDIQNEDMKAYLSQHSWNFSRKMFEWAASRMYKKNPAGDKVPVTPYSKEPLDTLLKQHNIKIEKANGYNAEYVATMCLADYYGSGVPGEVYLAKFVKDTLDDPDAPDGHVFTRFYADCIAGGVSIPWKDLI